VKTQEAISRLARAVWGTRRARLATAVAAALVVALAARAGRARTVPAHVAERRPLVQRVVASGRVMAPARITLASLTLARVVEVAVREGDAVRAGQLLLRLDDAEARAALAQARGRVQEAAARLDQVRGVSTRTTAEAVRQAELEVAQGERDLERVQRLFDGGAASAAQLDQATQALSLARSRAETATIQAASVRGEGAEARLAAAALRQAQAAEAVARARLDERQLRAPSAALVLTRDVEVGDVVAAGRALLVLAEEGPTRLTVQPDEKNLAVLRAGQPAEAVADAFPGAPFPAAVSYIAPAVDPARGTVEVRLAVPRPPPFLRPDMTVSVNVEVGRKGDALVIPAEAVRDVATEPWVLRIADGRAERRAVRVGLRGEGMIEVVDGLAPGDAVVLPAAGVIEDGARVRARRVDAPALLGGTTERGRAL
jgi:HlyD family secretion protein